MRAPYSEYVACHRNVTCERTSAWQRFIAVIFGVAHQATGTYQVTT